MPKIRSQRAHIHASEISLAEIGATYKAETGRYPTKDLLHFLNQANISPLRIVPGHKVGTKNRIYNRSDVVDFFNSRAGLHISPLAHRVILDTTATVVHENNEMYYTEGAIRSMYGSVVGGDFHGRWVKFGLPFKTVVVSDDVRAKMYTHSDVVKYFRNFGRPDRLDPASKILQNHFAELTGLSQMDITDAELMLTMMKDRPGLKKLIAAKM